MYMQFVASFYLQLQIGNSIAWCLVRVCGLQLWVCSCDRSNNGVLKDSTKVRIQRRVYEELKAIHYCPEQSETFLLWWRMKCAWYIPLAFLMYCISCACMEGKGMCISYCYSICLFIYINYSHATNNAWGRRGHGLIQLCTPYPPIQRQLFFQLAQRLSLYWWYSQALEGVTFYGRIQSDSKVGCKIGIGTVRH